jgi:hypothetical protein
MEFSLTRPSVVIGRTDENDITLNHRSISRHHAKIVRERDHYTILDLQSANGVRVNGEDYERIELHAGDMVELGHVRVRFVGPGETFVFDAKAALGGAKFPAKAAMTLVGIALAAVAIIVYQRGGRPHVVEQLTGVAANHPAANPPPATAAEAPAPVAPAPTPAAPVAAAAATPATPAELLAKAATDAKSEDWDAALSSLDQMSARTDEAIDPRTRRQAADLRRKIESERRGGVAFAKFEQASTAKNYAEALERFAEIPNESLYKKRARPRFEEARTLYVAQHLTAAEKFRAGGKCTEAKAEAEQVEKVDPNNALVKELVRMCKPRGEPVAAVALAGARPPRQRLAAAAVSVAKAEPVSIRQAAETSTEKAEAPAADAEPDADALIKQAREAWLRQQCGSAIDLSRKALKARPGLVDAYQVIAVCSCSLKDAESAGRAYAKLDERSRNLVKALCVKHGITVGGE